MFHLSATGGELVDTSVAAPARILASMQVGEGEPSSTKRAIFATVNER